MSYKSFADILQNSNKTTTYPEADGSSGVHIKSLENMVGIAGHLCNYRQLYTYSNGKSKLFFYNICLNFKVQ
jgi:hypothetical protein